MAVPARRQISGGASEGTDIRSYMTRGTPYKVHGLTYNSTDFHKYSHPPTHPSARNS